MPLEEILERNGRFVANRRAQPLPPAGSVPLIVLACYDPRLDGLLLPALGLSPGEAFLFRTPGAFVPPGSSTLRSLMVAVFLLQAREILILGHSSCLMASFETASFIDAFRARGILREAFGSGDLREWAGAIPSPRRGVELSLESILSDPARPPDLMVSGAVLDDAAGSLHPVPLPSEMDLGKGASPAVGVAEPADDTKTAPAKPEAPKKPEPATTADPLVDAVEGMVHVLRSNAKWRYEVGRLRKELMREGNPVAKLNLLARFVQRAGAESSELLQAYELFKQKAVASGRSHDSKELVRLFQHLVTKL